MAIWNCHIDKKQMCIEDEEECFYFQCTDWEEPGTNFENFLRVYSLPQVYVRICHKLCNGIHPLLRGKIFVEICENL